MYSRWQPGLPEVLIFLAIVVTALQYVSLMVTYRNDVHRISEIVRMAKIARGPTDGKRKVNVPLSGQPLDKNEGRVPMVELMVDGDDVFMVSP